MPHLLWVLFLCASPLTCQAQSLQLDLGHSGDSGVTGRLIQLVALITVLSIAPSLLVMSTAFTRIVIVLSLLRSALSTQGTPPNMVLIGLALILTFFVMEPVFHEAWDSGIHPMVEGNVSEGEGLQLAAAPFHRFMTANTRDSDLVFFAELGRFTLPPSQADAPWRAVIPAFVVGELRKGFEIGFLLYLPFLIIDFLVASVLMSLGMMMLPPNVVSLPFKLIFFVVVDGWHLLAGSLIRSFAPS